MCCVNTYFLRWITSQSSFEGNNIIFIPAAIPHTYDILSYVLFIDCGERLITPEYLFDIDLEDDIYAIPKPNTSEFMYCIKTNSLIQYDGNFPINKEDAVVLYMDNEV